MHPSFEAALAEEGKAQEVLLRDLPGAVLAELAELESARFDPDRFATQLEELGKHGVYRLLRNRTANRLRKSGSAQKAEARERARKAEHEAPGVYPRASRRKEREEGFRGSRTPPPPGEEALEDFELAETLRQQLGQLEGWLERTKFSEREQQVYELDMRSSFDTATIARELDMGSGLTPRVRPY